MDKVCVNNGRSDDVAAPQTAFQAHSFIFRLDDFGSESFFPRPPVTRRLIDTGNLEDATAGWEAADSCACDFLRPQSRAKELEVYISCASENNIVLRMFPQKTLGWAENVPK